MAAHRRYPPISPDEPAIFRDADQYMNHSKAVASALRTQSVLGCREPAFANMSPKEPDPADKAISAKRLEANRRNARLSTGPRTAEGKARVKFNALRMGLYAGSALLPGEDPEQYKAMMEPLDAQYAHNPLQRLLAHNAASAAWKIRRHERTIEHIADQRFIESEKTRLRELAKYPESPLEPATAAQLLAEEYKALANGKGDQRIRLLDNEVLRQANAMTRTSNAIARLDEKKPGKAAREKASHGNAARENAAGESAARQSAAGSPGTGKARRPAATGRTSSDVPPGMTADAPEPYKKLSSDERFARLRGKKVPRYDDNFKLIVDDDIPPHRWWPKDPPEGTPLSEWNYLPPGMERHGEQGAGDPDAGPPGGNDVAANHADENDAGVNDLGVNDLGANDLGANDADAAAPAWELPAHADGDESSAAAPAPNEPAVRWEFADDPAAAMSSDSGTCGADVSKMGNKATASATIAIPSPGVDATESGNEPNPSASPSIATADGNNATESAGEATASAAGLDPSAVPPDRFARERAIIYGYHWTKRRDAFNQAWHRTRVEFDMSVPPPMPDDWQPGMPIPEELLVARGEGWVSRPKWDPVAPGRSREPAPEPDEKVSRDPKGSAETEVSQQANS